nr:copia protein [Tanacetum cinerariifolium]
CEDLSEADHCQPPQYTVNHPIFNAHNDLLNANNDLLNSQNKITIAQNKLMEQLTSMCAMIPSFCDDDDDSAITPNKPVDSLSMEDEHLNTILATESDEFIKFYVKNLVLNPSESEGKSECDMRAREEFTTVSNVLFDADYEFDSVDNQSLHDVDISEKIFSNPLFDEEIISVRNDPHYFNAESDLIESLLNHDSSIIPSSSKIDSLLDEFVGELILLKSISPGINKTDCYHEKEIRFIERLFDSFMEEIDLSFNPDDLMSPSIEEDDDDSERDILIHEELVDNYSLSLPVNESFHFDIPSFSRPPAKPPNGNTGILNIKMMGDNSEQKAPMPKLTITCVLNQEKSPDLLSHRSLENFQLFTCPMMIHGKNIPILDAEDSVIISIPPLVGGMADMVVEIKEVQKDRIRYNQQEGIDYDETYAPVARLKSIRILLAYACALDFKLFQMYVKSAFLNGFINEEYVAQPPGFIDFKKPNHAYKSKKALYGLKQAPKAWYGRLKAFLNKHEYKMGMVDNTLFTKKKSSNLIIVQIYVDDIIFDSTCQDMYDEFAKIMHDEFEMSMMGELNFFFGFQIKQMKDGIFINQSKYIKEMLKKFGLEDSKPIKTPMSSDTKLTKDKECESIDSTKYRGMIGLWYHKGTGIETVVYADSDHAGVYVDRKSTSDEDKEIKITEKKNLENDIVDETLEIDEIVNIKESRNHPLENVIGNLNQRTLRSQAQNQIPQPRNMTIIGTKWVFRNKLDENGVVSRNKARLVAQGYNQQEGIDYDETYSPVARLESIRILLAYACALDFKLFQMDVKSAFLNGFINKEVYVAQPSGFIDFEKPDHVYKLKKALYGLKQAPKAWPDIMFSVCLCTHFQEAPKTSHLKAVKRIFRYIKGTMHLGLWYPMGTNIETVVYADSDHAGDYVDRKSTSVICTFVGCCLTSWFSKKQTALTISTTEAEYLSAGKACQQALWIKQALIDYDVRLNDVPIMCDNKGAINLSKNPVQHSSTKHIKIRHHFLRDNVPKEHISIEKLPSVDNIADILTKPLKGESFNYLCLDLGMMEHIP